MNLTLEQRVDAINDPSEALALTMELFHKAACPMSGAVSTKKFTTQRGKTIYKKTQQQ